MEPHPAEAWQRLGVLLKRRRVQLDPRYRVRKVFAAERGITDKTAQEIENAYRVTFSDEMIAAVELAYGLSAGAIERALNGGELEPAQEAPRGVVDAEERKYLDLLGGLDPDPARGEKTVWDLDLSPEDRYKVIMAMRERDAAIWAAVRRAVYPRRDDDLGAGNGTNG